METNHVLVNVNISEKIIVLLEVFCSFQTVYGQSKMYVLFGYNRIQRNIRKGNQSFGPGDCINFFFGLEISFEMSEGRLNVSCFSERQIINVKTKAQFCSIYQASSKTVFVMYQTRLFACQQLPFHLI